MSRLHAATIRALAVMLLVRSSRQQPEHPNFPGVKVQGDNRASELKSIRARIAEVRQELEMERAR